VESVVEYTLLFRQCVNTPPRTGDVKHVEVLPLPNWMYSIDVLELSTVTLCYCLQA